MTKVGHGGSGWRRDGEREREKEDSREDEKKRLCTTTIIIAGRWVCWVEKKEIADLGLLTQTKISKDLFLIPKSPSLFHLSKALKSLSHIVDLEKSLKLFLGSMVVKWWLVQWLVGVDRWMGLTLVWVAVA